MKTTKMVLVTLITLSVSFYACKKDKNTIQHSSNVKTLFAQLREPSQFFTINSSSQQLITGSKGTRLTFTPGSFVTKTGQAVNGNIQIELKEIYSTGDMIRSNYTTTSNGMLLGSGGELLVKATQNGQELVMQSFYLVQMPGTFATFNPNMQLFYGQLLPDTIAGDSTMNWTPVDSTNMWIDTTATGGGNTDFYYSFYSDSLTFINCDYFYYASPRTPLAITCNDTFNGRNCNVFIVFNSINSVTSVYDNDRNGTFTTGWGYEAPVGMNVTIVAIAQVNGQYYSSFTPVTIAANGNHSITLSPTTLADFETALDQL